jgi:hypothetical protein
MGHQQLPALATAFTPAPVESGHAGERTLAICREFRGDKGRGQSSTNGQQGVLRPPVRQASADELLVVLIGDGRRRARLPLREVAQIDEPKSIRLGDETSVPHDLERARGDPIDWDGMDEYEMTKLDWADQFERHGMFEAAEELRAEYWAEEEAREAEKASALHERRSAAARKGAQTRKERQAERAAAVAAAKAIFRAVQE